MAGRTLLMLSIGVLSIPVLAQFTGLGDETRMVILFAVFLVSLLLFLASWKRRHVGLSAFLHAYFINLIVGNVRSFFGIFVFILLAAILTQWLPDAIESGSLYWALWNVLYLLSILFMTYSVSVPSKVREEGLRKTRYLVFALSWPNWSPTTLAEAECEKLFRNSADLSGKGGRPPNIVPLFVAAAHHLERLERVYLLVSRSELGYRVGDPKERERLHSYLHSRGVTPEGNDFRDTVRLILLKLSECTGRGITVEWPDGSFERLGGGDIVFKLAVAGDFDDVDECRSVIRSLTERIIERESEELTFDLTGGKTLVSVAMALTAIRRECQAEYMRQNVYDEAPEKLLKKVDLDIFTVEDLLEELKEVFEED